MSKRKKKKARRIPSGYDRHHLLFYKREWFKYYAQKLRRCFVYEIPIAIHQELHSEVGAVPVLDEEDARELWIRFQAEDGEMSILEACEWLIANSPSAEFSAAIMAQMEFLQNH